MEKREQLAKIFPQTMRKMFLKDSFEFNKLQEIRLRTNKPVIISYNNREYYVSNNGKLQTDSTDAYLISKREMKETMEFVSSYSLYAYEEEIKQGFITIQGGHRVGLAGKVVVEGEKVKLIKYISCMNIRLAHEVIGCGDKIMPYIVTNSEIENTLIISPPSAGKTTLLRDIIRQCSNGNSLLKGISVGVVDERSEIGACYMGEPQNDLGIRTDILDNCPKAVGIMMLIRTMSPKLIAVDEIGSKEDIEAILYSCNCGCSLIETIHGSSLEDLEKKPRIKELIERRIFSRFVILDKTYGVGTVAYVLNEKKEPIYDRNKNSYIKL